MTFWNSSHHDQNQRYFDAFFCVHLHQRTWIWILRRAMVTMVDHLIFQFCPDHPLSSTSLRPWKKAAAKGIWLRLSKCVCVWAVSIDVKLVSCIIYCRGTLPIVMLSVQRRGHHYGLIWFWDARVTYLPLFETTVDMVILLKPWSWGLLLPFLKLFVSHQIAWNIHYHELGTERAIIPVKVCNLWWMSDKVPQGRGFDPVQLLSRRKYDSSNQRMNLQTLIGNSFK